VLVVVLLGCQSENGHEPEVLAPAKVEAQPAEPAPSKAPEPTSKPAPAPEVVAEDVAAARGDTGQFCSQREKWALMQRYGIMIGCTSALKEGCGESLGSMLASVERALQMDPERLRRAGGDMAGLIGVFGDQVDTSVLKPARTMSQEIKAYRPSAQEKDTHATLVADYESFLKIATRWSKMLHTYRGDVGALADLQTETEKAETKALAHDVRYRALCNGTSK
jgi:hypothetical protein